MPTSAEGAARAIDDADLLPSVKKIGGYTIRGVVGVGGMGVVYRAEQTSPKRIVALKVIRPGLVSTSLMRRFEHEAQVLGRLQHPGIAAIHEAGAADTPAGVTPYFAMEFVAGRELERYLSDERPNPARVADLFAKICDAVQHAHTKGVIHRDLKPSNVLVDRSGHPKILDFGVARATDADIQAVTIETSAGTLIGTVPYMSPEQIAGDPGALDTRSDVYTLGVLLFEALAGRLPHDLQDATIIEAARTITETEPRSLASVAPRHRGDLATIVDKALEQDRERRYQSAGDLAADLRRFIGDEPISARPPSTAYLFRKFARRNKAFVAAGAAIVLALLGVTAAAIAAAVASERENRRSEEVADFFGDILLRPDPTSLGGRRDITLFEVLQENTSRIDEEFADRPRFAGELHERFGETLYNLGHVAEARAEFERAHELLEGELGPDDPTVLLQLSNLAIIDRDAGELDSAAKIFVRLIERERGRSRSDARLLSSYLDSLGGVYRRLGQLDNAERLYTEAIERREAIVADPGDASATDRTIDAWSLRASINNLALVRRESGRLREAHAALAALLQDCKDAEAAEGDVKHTLTFTVMRNLGITLADLGRLDEAIELQRAAHEANLATLGPSHLRTIGSGITLGKSLGFADRRDEAEQLLRVCVRRAEEDPDIGPAHLVTKLGWLGLADVLRSMDRADEAVAITSAMVNAIDTHDTTTPERVRNAAWLTHGRVLLALDDAPGAIEALRRPATALDRSLGPEHWRTADATAWLAAALQRAGHRAESQPMADAALRRLQEALGEAHWRVRAAHQRLGVNPDAS
ncbi:MAG: serine/threonine-protein kinase [Planctomycetota bacterium]